MKRVVADAGHMSGHQACLDADAQRQFAHEVALLRAWQARW
jgi:hypothetical protein